MHREGITPSLFEKEKALENNLNKTSVLLLMRLSKAGNRRKVESGLVQVDADKEVISVNKMLLECPELNAISTLDGQIRQWVYARSLPSGVLKEGVYRLPLSLVDEVDAGLKDFDNQRKEKIEAFLFVYPAQIDMARMRLRALYNATDYPPVSQMREAFDFQWRYLTLDVPETINNLLVKEQREKAEADLAVEMDEIRLALRSAFAELISHAASALSPGPENKPKVFRDSLVDNLDQFFRYFDARNLSGDNALADLVERARAVMRGVTPDDLRKDLSTRQLVQQTMEQVKKTITEGAMLKPTRRFTMAPELAHA